MDSLWAEAQQKTSVFVCELLQFCPETAVGLCPNSEFSELSHFTKSEETLHTSRCCRLTVCHYQIFQYFLSYGLR